MLNSYTFIYIGIFVLVLLLYVRRQSRRQRAHLAQLKEAQEAGLVEPPSLHPIVDPTRCMGSGACVTACPEKALGVVNGKAVLINAAHCIGHGACAAACPVQSISLVFGTEKRGIDIPNVSPTFETNVPGIFIAGELGGMGLVRKACEQGRQAVHALAQKSDPSAEYDVVIVGCGPAGLSAGLACIEKKLRYKIVEQEESLGGAVFHYPRQKMTMTAPVDLAIVGKVKFGEVQKEKLLEFWLDVVNKTGLQVSYSERMEKVDKDDKGHFVVHTSKGKYGAATVLLSMGRRGTPRKLDVPGEDSPKVAYRLVDPTQYQGKAVLVVGGGDSALEAAIALSEVPDTRVTLSYRSEAFSRVKPKNRDRLDAQKKAKRIRVVLKSQIKSVHDDYVIMDYKDASRRVRNDHIIVCAGGLLPTPLLQKIGIQFDTKFGTK
jgi:thioredoxin reductase/Pyruvate/2-oxoacid:ferredoxin oxidoreductase delta subunit